MPSLGLLSLVASVPLGGLGWLATNFIARPILRVYELREKAWEEILATANISMLDGSLYVNRSGGASTTLYVKESGGSTNAGWVAK